MEKLFKISRTKVKQITINKMNDISTIRPDGLFELKYCLDSIFYKHLIGKQGSNLAKLKKETGTDIFIRAVNDKNKSNEIRIVGKSDNLINAAKRFLDNEVSKIKERLSYNYFISIPIKDIEIQNKFLEFKNVICSQNLVPDLSIERTTKLFTKPEKLHITIGMLKLFTNEDKIKALNVLENCNRIVFNPFLEKNGPITFHVKGTSTFSQDGDNIKVLFSPILEQNGQPHTKMQEIVDLVHEFFVKNNLMEANEKSVKMHVTLMKAQYHNMRVKPKLKHFNANQIFQQFADFDFGSVVLQKLHLSSRGTEADDGYYDTIKLSDFDIS